MHEDLSSHFVHDTVVNREMEVFKGGHDGGEIRGILFVVQGRAVERGRKDVVDAGGSSTGED